MQNQNLIPEFTEENFKLKDQDAKNLESWITGLRGLHPRVKVQSFTDPDFSFENYLNQARTYLDERATYLNRTGVFKIPERGTKVALIASFDHSTTSLTSDYSAEGSIVLCFGKLAWMCEWGAFGINVEIPKNESKSLIYTPKLYQWGHAARYLKNRLYEFLAEQEIPKFPKQKPAH